MIHLYKLLILLDNKLFNGGDEKIRTSDTLVRYAPLAGECLRPLGHVSVSNEGRQYNDFAASGQWKINWFGPVRTFYAERGPPIQDVFRHFL